MDAMNVISAINIMILMTNPDTIAKIKTTAIILFMQTIANLRVINHIPYAIIMLFIIKISVMPF